MPKQKHKLNCPKCHSGRVNESSKRALESMLARLLPIHTYHCLYCYKRFWVWRRASFDLRLFSGWFVLTSIVVGFYLFYGWASTPTASQIQAQTDTTAVESSDQTIIRAVELVEPEDRRELVENIAFNQPNSDTKNDDFKEEDIATISKLEFEQKLAEAKTLANDAALASPQANAVSADSTEVDPDELRSLIKVDINYLIEQWRLAWQSGDSDTYLSFYSSQFVPTEQATLQDWQAQRRLRVVPTKKITLGLSNFEVTLDDANQTSIVTFDQAYRSATYRDDSRKELTLLKEDEWRIISEVTLQ